MNELQDTFKKDDAFLSQSNRSAMSGVSGHNSPYFASRTTDKGTGTHHIRKPIKVVKRMTEGSKEQVDVQMHTFQNEPVQSQTFENKPQSIQSISSGKQKKRVSPVAIEGIRINMKHKKIMKNDKYCAKCARQIACSLPHHRNIPYEYMQFYNECQYMNYRIRNDNLDETPSLRVDSLNMDTFHTGFGDNQDHLKGRENIVVGDEMFDKNQKPRTITHENIQKEIIKSKEEKEKKRKREEVRSINDSSFRFKLDNDNLPNTEMEKIPSEHAQLQQPRYSIHTGQVQVSNRKIKTSNQAFRAKPLDSRGAQRRANDGQSLDQSYMINLGPHAMSKGYTPRDSMMNTVNSQQRKPRTPYCLPRDCSLIIEGQSTSRQKQGSEETERRMEIEVAQEAEQEGPTTKEDTQCSLRPRSREEYVKYPQTNEYYERLQANNAKVIEQINDLRAYASGERRVRQQRMMGKHVCQKLQDKVTITDYLEKARPDDLREDQIRMGDQGVYLKSSQQNRHQCVTESHESKIDQNCLSGPKEKYSRVEQVLNKIDRNLWVKNYEVWDIDNKFIDQLRDNECKERLYDKIMGKMAFQRQFSSAIMKAPASKRPHWMKVNVSLIDQIRANSTLRSDVKTGPIGLLDQKKYTTAFSLRRQSEPIKQSLKKATQDKPPSNMQMRFPDARHDSVKASSLLKRLKISHNLAIKQKQEKQDQNQVSLLDPFEVKKKEKLKQKLLMQTNFDPVTQSDGLEETHDVHYAAQQLFKHPLKMVQLNQFPSAKQEMEVLPLSERQRQMRNVSQGMTQRQSTKESIRPGRVASVEMKCPFFVGTITGINQAAASGQKLSSQKSGDMYHDSEAISAMNMTIKHNPDAISSQGAFGNEKDKIIGWQQHDLLFQFPPDVSNEKPKKVDVFQPLTNSKTAIQDQKEIQVQKEISEQIKSPKLDIKPQVTSSDGTQFKEKQIQTKMENYAINQTMPIGQVQIARRNDEQPVTIPGTTKTYHRFDHNLDGIETRTVENSKDIELTHADNPVETQLSASRSPMPESQLQIHPLPPEILNKRSDDLSKMTEETICNSKQAINSQRKNIEFDPHGILTIHVRNQPQKMKKPNQDLILTHKNQIVALRNHNFIPAANIQGDQLIQSKQVKKVFNLSNKARQSDYLNKFATIQEQYTSNISRTSPASGGNTLSPKSINRSSNETFSKLKNINDDLLEQVRNQLSPEKVLSLKGSPVESRTNVISPTSATTPNQLKGQSSLKKQNKQNVTLQTKKHNTSPQTEKQRSEYDRNQSFNYNDSLVTQKQSQNKKLVIFQDPDNTEPSLRAESFLLSNRQTNTRGLSELSRLSNKKQSENYQDLYFKNKAQLSAQMNVESRLDPQEFNNRVQKQNSRSKSITPCLNTTNNMLKDTLQRNHKYHQKQIAKIVDTKQYIDSLNIRGRCGTTTPNHVRIVFAGKIDESHSLVDKFKSKLNSRENKRQNKQTDQATQKREQVIKYNPSKGVGTNQPVDNTRFQNHPFNFHLAGTLYLKEQSNQSLASRQWPALPTTERQNMTTGTFQSIVDILEQRDFRRSTNISDMFSVEGADGHKLKQVPTGATSIVQPSFKNINAPESSRKYFQQQQQNPSMPAEDISLIKLNAPSRFEQFNRNQALAYNTGHTINKIYHNPARVPYKQEPVEYEMMQRRSRAVSQVQTTKGSNLDLNSSQRGQDRQILVDLGVNLPTVNSLENTMNEHEDDPNYCSFLQNKQRN